MRKSVRTNKRKIKRTKRKKNNNNVSIRRKSKKRASKKKSSKNNDLKKLKILEKKLEKLYINNGPTKEIDKTSKKIEELISKMKYKQRNIKKSKKSNKRKSGYSKILQYNPYPE